MSLLPIHQGVFRVIDLTCWPALTTLTPLLLVKLSATITGCRLTQWSTGSAHSKQSQAKWWWTLERSTPRGNLQSGPITETRNYLWIANQSLLYQPNISSRASSQIIKMTARFLNDRPNNLVSDIFKFHFCCLSNFMKKSSWTFLLFGCWQSIIRRI